MIERYVDELNKRNLSILDELVADEVVLGSLMRGDDLLQPEVGRQEYRRGIEDRLKAFPDYAVTIKEMIAESDQVVLYWSCRGTQRGDYLGVKPTGKVIEGVAVSIYRIVQGKIVEVRGIWDRADTWQQLGLIPETQIVSPAIGELQ